MNQPLDTLIRDYLRDKGWDWTERQEASGLHARTGCPFCGKAKHLYINLSSGAWDCKSCARAGGFRALREELGDVTPIQHLAHASPGARRAPIAGPAAALPTMADVERSETALWGDGPDAEAARAYLLETRRLPEKIVRDARVGLWARWNKAWIGLPYLRDGAVHNVKFRSIPPAEKAFARWEGGSSDLYAADSLAGAKIVTLVEGEMDVLAMRAYGLHAVASTSLGARGWNDAWSAPLADSELVLIAYDQDEEGEAGAKALSEKIGRVRCCRVRLPRKDAGDCLRDGITNAEIGRCLGDAEPMVGVRLQHISTLVGDLLAAEGKDHGTSTPWPDLNALVGGLRPGDLWIISGQTGQGKSTWTSHMAYREAREGVPCLIFPAEQRPADLVRKMASAWLASSWYTANQQQRQFAVAGLSELPIYVLNHYGRLRPDDLRDALRFAVQSLQVRLVVLDHLHFFWPVRPEWERQDLGLAIETIKAWSQELGVTTILVVHPGKTKNAVPHLADLRGASQLEQTADVILFTRPRRPKKGDTSARDLMILDVEKVRFDGGRVGRVVLRFNRPEQSYSAVLPGSTDDPAATGETPDEEDGDDEAY